MKKETFYCDVCGAEKKEANHWYRFVAEGPGEFRICKWTGRVNADVIQQHICGRGCLNKRIEKWLSA